jgi:putative transposase
MYMKIFNINKGVVGSRTMYNAVSRKRQYQDKQVKIMEERVKIVQHSKEFGIDSAISAFGVSKRTLCRWRKVLKSKSNIYDLIPQSTKPKNIRESKVKPEIVKYIQELKVEYAKLGKDKISRLISDTLGEIVSPTKVQDIVNNLKERGILRKKVKFSLNGKTGKLHILQRKKRKFKARRDGFIPSKKGELVQVDTVVVSYFGKRYYLITGIDIWNRLAFAKIYTSHSSKTASVFLMEMVAYFKYAVERVQTDNGSEFNLHFDEACKESNIIHFYNYPRSPKMNAFVERFNRTIQDEFLCKFVNVLINENFVSFNSHLLDYLKFYNQVRPHWGLGLNTPMKYTREMCQMCSG